MPPAPDFNRLRKILLRQGEPDRLPIVELFADREIMEAIIGEKIASPARQDFTARRKALDQTLRFWYETGYDYITVQAVVDLPQHQSQADDTAALSRGKRTWTDEGRGMITTWEEFERYPWPKPQDVDYYNLEYISQRLPDGMKMIYLGPGGQLENIMWLMGYASLAYALTDQPGLVEAMSQKVGELLVSVFTTAAEVPGMGALWLGDDMGFKTATMIAPRHLRQYVFPWQKKLVQIAHAHDLPFLLHACGNLSRVMDDLIDYVGIDAKHSFEDVIQPVADAKRQYGQRLALLGGVDVDYLVRHSPEEVRAYTRRVIEACAPGGGYALGTGNSVTNYIPVENYLAMVDEGLNWKYS